MMKSKYTNAQIQFNKIVGVNLRFLRLKNHLTQKQLAEKVGVRFQQIQKYEDGLNACCFYRINFICKLFNVPMHYLCDPDFTAKDLAEQECKALNNGEVKHKDFQNAFAHYKNIEEQMDRDDYLDKLKGKFNAKNN